jgi:hypothetical protein
MIRSPLRAASIDTGRETTWLGIVGMKVLDPVCTEHPIDGWHQVAAVNDVRIDHHSRSVKRPQGQEARGKDLRNLVDLKLSLNSVFTHKNRVSRLIGGGGR